MDELSSLATAAAAGDRWALASFIRQSQAEVWRLCAHLVDRRSADDLTQETYLRAVPALARFRADASARTWLLVIARRVCADAIRRRRRQRGLIHRLSRAAPLSEEFGSGDTQEVELDGMLTALAPNRRSAFVLTQLLGLSYAEAAVVCDCPVGTIRSRVARARVELLQAWGRRPMTSMTGSADQ